MTDPTRPTYPYEVLRPVEVFVVSRPRRRYWLHILLLAATFFTTLVVGARLEFNYHNGLPLFTDETLAIFPVAWALDHPANLLLGIPFSISLMAILLSHEMGHYFYCLRYGIYATLPFFIPAPTLIGTLGAFIRIKSPIRSRAALFDVGIAGPIAGFIVSVVVLFVGLSLSRPSMSHDLPELGLPLIFAVVQQSLAAGGATGLAGIPVHSIDLHPIAIAAWVGMFATSLNLLPGGQLDGGHIVYALAPRAHRHVTVIISGILIPLTLLWPGWFIWAVILFLTGIRHPQVPAWPPVDAKRRSLGVLALVMLVLTFVPVPFPQHALLKIFYR